MPAGTTTESVSLPRACTSGLDLEVRQQLHSRAGNFALGVTGNYVFRFGQAAAAA